MSRLKIALGLIAIAGTVALIAISFRLRDSERKGMEQRQSADSVAVRQKNVAVQSSKNDAILNKFLTSPGESDRAQTDAPRMQTKQIKMH